MGMHGGTLLTRALWAVVSVMGLVATLCWVGFGVSQSTQVLGAAIGVTMLMVLATLPAGIAHSVWGN